MIFKITRILIILKTTGPIIPILKVLGYARVEFVENKTKTTIGSVWCVENLNSSPDIKGEITLGYLETTHITRETYEQRLARRNSFEAGMKAGSQVPATDYSIKHPQRAIFVFPTWSLVIIK